MNSDVKKLSLVDVILHRQGSFALRLLHAIFGITLSLFFRRIELVNADKLPKNSGLMFVANHPNALIDPALLFVALPRKIAFLAKHTLFKMPVLGYLIKTVGALPLYRQQDAGADVSKNQETFEIARKLLKSGGAIALFPEGISHNEPQLQPLKTGAARIALGSVSVGKNPSSLDLQVVPVGLFYTNKTTFRSEALLHFGEPFRVLPIELEADGQPSREDVRKLNEQMEKALREVTLNAESQAKLTTARIAEEIFTSVTPHEENLAERFDLQQKFLSETEQDFNLSLEYRLSEYDKKLDKLGIESEFLELAKFSKRFVFFEALRRSWYLVLLAPFVVIGAILHFPAYQISKFLSFLETRKGNFDMASTMKVLSSLVLIPLTWLISAAVLYFYFGWKIALVSIPFSFLCGYIALRTLEEIQEMRGWINTILLFIANRRKFLRLLAERQNLYERVKGKPKV